MEIEILSEADTRAKLIDPVLHSIGWTEDHIHREETARGIDIIESKPKRRARGRKDRHSFSVAEVHNIMKHFSNSLILSLLPMIAGNVA